MRRTLAATTERIGCVVGAGYVGLPTALMLSRRLARVRLLEADPVRLEALRRGCAPMHEPGIERELRHRLSSGRLQLGGEAGWGVEDAGTVVIAVGSPSQPDGAADLSEVRGALQALLPLAVPEAVVVLKTTVPPGTTNALQREYARVLGARRLVACPEFLREGSALEDARRPSRLVIGALDDRAARRVRRLFATPGVPVVRTDPTSAELIKYAANAFLALKISYANEIAQLCDAVGADAMTVMTGVAADPRIGAAHLRPGLGFGGSCLPKDVRALRATATAAGTPLPLLEETLRINDAAPRRAVDALAELLGGTVTGARIAVLGLSFKPGTSDLRESSALAAIGLLQRAGAQVSASDPVALPQLPGVLVAESVDAAVEGADALLLATDWPQYRRLDWTRLRALMRGDAVVDGRNCLDPARLRRAGLRYRGTGIRQGAPPLRALRSRPLPSRVAAASVA